MERAIGYARQNFWPLREFTDLHDVNRQVRQWRSEVANQRQHRETRQRPLDRFQPAALKPLPVIPYDHRDPLLNELATDPLSLLEYDAFILKPGKEPDDSPRTEAEPTEPVRHEPSTGDDPD